MKQVRIQQKSGKIVNFGLILLFCVNIKKGERERAQQWMCSMCLSDNFAWKLEKKLLVKANNILFATLSENDVLARVCVCVCYVFKINDKTRRDTHYFFSSVCTNEKQSSRNVYWLLATVLVLVAQVNTLCKQRRSATFQPTRAMKTNTKLNACTLWKKNTKLQYQLSARDIKLPQNEKTNTKTENRKKSTRKLCVK